MPNLTFAENRQNYVGVPLDAADNTLDTLQTKYIQNKDAADKLEIMLNNLELLPGDQAYKDQVATQVSSVLDDVTKNGDWENATLHVANAAKAFAGDPALNNAIKSKQQREQSVAALKEKVGKPFEEGGITNEDFQREVQKADTNYKGVYNEDGIWKGHWSAKTPPAYLDRGEYIDKFLEGWKSNKLMGSVTKGDDGKWYKVKYTTTPDGTHHITEYTEEASNKDVYAAARKHLTQNANVRERIAYEVSNTPGTFEDYKAIGINRDSMTKELKDLGMDENNLNSMSDEKLTETFKTEMVVYDSVKGAVDKHSFKHESVQVLGKTWDQIQRETRLNNATKKGGDEQTVMVDRALALFTTKGYDAANIPKSIDDYQKNIDLWGGEVVKHRKAIDQIKAEIAKNPDDKILPVELASAQTKLLEYERTAKEYDYWYESALKKVLSGNSDVSKEELDNYFASKSELNELRDSPTVQKVTKVLETKFRPTLRAGMVVVPELVSPANRIGDVHNLVKSGKLTKDEADEYIKFARLQDSSTSFFGKINSQGKDTINAINAEMKRQAEEKTISYGYVDLSVDEFGKETAFAKRNTELLRNNYANYKVLETDGEAVEFNNLDENDKYIPANTTVLGVTTQYVGDHGYLMYAREDMFDKDNKKTGERFHLIKPTSQSGLLDSAVSEARKGTRVEKNQLKPGYDINSPNELEQIWRFTDVDRQMAAFDNHPLIAPADEGSNETYKEVSKPVNIGVKYQADVTRKVNNAGDVKWTVNVRDKETGEFGTQTYASQYDAEFALEYLAGSGYAVPLSSLKRMTDYDFSNGTIDRNQVSTPYMAPDFYSEMKKFDNMINASFTITSMTRSVEQNKESNGVDTSRHKYGKGVDLKADEAVTDWLATHSTDIPNSKYKKIMGADLMYLVHDAGSGNHIHVEHTKAPDGIKTTSDMQRALKDYTTILANKFQ